MLDQHVARGTSTNGVNGSNLETGLYVTNLM